VAFDSHAIVQAASLLRGPMNRRDFIASAAAAAAVSALPSHGEEQQTFYGFPPQVLAPDP